MQNYGSKADYIKMLNIVQKDYSNTLILHPNAYSFHSMKYYINQKQLKNNNYVFDPDRKLGYIQGTAALETIDYYPGSYDSLINQGHYQIGVMYLWGNPDFEKNIEKIGYKKTKSIRVENNLILDIWEFSKIVY